MLKMGDKTMAGKTCRTLVLFFDQQRVLEPRKNKGVRGTANLQYRGLLSNTDCRQPRVAASQAGIDGLEKGCWRTWDTINTKLRSSDK